MAQQMRDVPMIDPETVPTGTVVRLKSGGARMTVDWSLRNDGLPMVYWFDGGKLHKEAFPPSMLETIADEYVEPEYADKLQTFKVMMHNAR
jgi:uncharacterized protein YodC (DUF2158 family)